MQESTVFCCGNGECLSRSALSFASTEIKITAGSVGDIVASTKFIKKENKHVCNIYVVWSCMGVFGNTAFIHTRQNWRQLDFVLCFAENVLEESACSNKTLSEHLLQLYDPKLFSACRGHAQSGVGVASFLLQYLNKGESAHCE